MNSTMCSGKRRRAAGGGDASACPAVAEIDPNGTGRDGFAGKKEVLVDSVTFRFMPEAGARNAALEAGEVHLIEQVDGPTAKRLEANKNFTVYKALPFAFQVIKFNHAQAPTDDLNFRLAVQAALDMEEIMAIAYPDVYQMDPAWLYPKAAFHTDAGTSKFNKADLKAAKELLGKSSYKGEKLTFIIDSLRPNVDTATVVQQRLKEIGINVDLSVADWPTTSKIGFTDQGWHFWAHGYGIEPYRGSGVRDRAVGGRHVAAQEGRDDRQDLGVAQRRDGRGQAEGALRRVPDPHVRQRRRHEGRELRHLPDRDREAEELHALPDPTHVGRDPRAVSSDGAGAGAPAPAPFLAGSGNPRC